MSKSTQRFAAAAILGAVVASGAIATGATSHATDAGGTDTASATSSGTTSDPAAEPFGMSIGPATCTAADRSGKLQTSLVRITGPGGGPWTSFLTVTWATSGIQKRPGTITGKQTRVVKVSWPASITTSWLEADLGMPHATGITRQLALGGPDGLRNYSTDCSVPTAPTSTSTAPTKPPNPTPTSTASVEPPTPAPATATLGVTG